MDSDSPSGLDSLSAATVVTCLRNAAKVQGVTVVCTIHQPSREVFAAFDNLLLLKKGGICVYNGSVASLNDYLSAAGDSYATPKEANPADHTLDVFCGPVGAGTNWVRRYQKSEMVKKISDAINRPSSVGEISIDSASQSFASELFLVLQRQVVAHWRTNTYMALRFWWTVVACGLVGLVYFGSGTTGNVSNTVGSLFFYVNIATVPLLSAMVPLITERAVFYRETLSGTYGRFSYGAAVQLAELPFNLGFSLVAFVVFYFLIGLSMEGGRIIYFILMTLATYWVSFYWCRFSLWFGFLLNVLCCSLGSPCIRATPCIHLTQYWCRCRYWFPNLDTLHTYYGVSMMIVLACSMC